MRKPDDEVQEVVCSETGKPMPKIPLWMADIRVKFVSDEARQKHPSSMALADVEPIRKSLVVADPVDLKDLGEDLKVLDEDADLSDEEGEQEVEDLGGDDLSV